MQRRDFLKSLLAAGSVSLGNPRQALPSHESLAPAPPVSRVLVAFKCHLDVGFTDTQTNVVRTYHDEYFPGAIRVAADMRALGDDRYVWTTGSWLLHGYLDQAAPQDRDRMTQAIRRGDVAWHALPFSWQTELLDESLIAGALALSDSLDRRFGVKTTGAKLTDVPGHTRALVRPLAEHGVTFLDIGVNSASRTAEVPPLFLWQEPGGAQLVVMYHHGYGDVVYVPGSDLAIAIVVRGDNRGPHTPQEIVATYSDLRHRFPSAAVQAASFTTIANAINRYRDRLPVVTQEMGDTWIYGVASDPLKIARFREVARLRRGWLGSGAFVLGDATDVGLLSHLLLESEHTWGVDTKRWLDFDHYTAGDLAGIANTRPYQVVASSWAEKRRNLDVGLGTLPEPLRNEANAALRRLVPEETPRTGNSRRLRAGELETRHFVLRLDTDTGAIRGLVDRKSGREWASADHLLALFSYQTLSPEDYRRFFVEYIIRDADWVAKDFGKPEIERSGAASRVWQPSLLNVAVSRSGSSDRMVADLQIREDDASRAGRASFPRRMRLELVLPDDDARVDVNFCWFAKPAMRLPEALWLTFNPIASAPDGWSLQKAGQNVSPFDVVPGGARRMHAVSSGFSYRAEEHTLTVETLDAPVIAMGERSPLNFSRAQPNLSGGVHCCLFNNAWGTNYVQWFGENMRFRFVMRGSGG